jgi:hypothetical protein
MTASKRAGSVGSYPAGSSGGGGGGIATALAGVDFTTTDTGIYYHTTSPEGVVAAGPGSLCLVDDEGDGLLYQKVTGTGNTGWRFVRTLFTGYLANRSDTVTGGASVAVAVAAGQLYSHFVPISSAFAPCALDIQGTPTEGYQLTIKDTSGHAGEFPITVTAHATAGGTEYTIDGLASFVIDKPFGAVTLRMGRSNLWYVVGETKPETVTLSTGGENPTTTWETVGGGYVKLAGTRKLRALLAAPSGFTAAVQLVKASDGTVVTGTTTVATVATFVTVEAIVEANTAYLVQLKVDSGSPTSADIASLYMAEIY